MPFKNPESFWRDLRKFSGDHLGRIRKKVKRAMGLEVIRRVVPPTPRDTGNAQGNYQINVGDLDLTERDGTEVSLSQQVKEASQSLSAATPSESVWIVNPTIYISFLNDGASEQHEGGFWEAAIDETNRMEFDF